MSRQRRFAVAALALVLATAGGACGGKSNEAANASSKKKSDKQETAAPASAGGDAAASADAKASAGASKNAATTDGKKAAGGAKSASAAGATTTSIDVKKAAEAAGLDVSRFEGDWIDGSPKGMSADDPRPHGCNFSPGQICRFEVTGRYGLKSQEIATIEVGAYDNGETKPSFSTKLPNAKKGGSAWFVREFPYSAREDVKEMAIIVRLLAADGKELARGKPTVFPVEKLRG
jgi:hypothetical protein